MTRRTTRLLWALALLPVAGWSGGCAALTNPVADGIPVRRLPAEVLGRPRSELHPLPLNLLRQKEPDEYRLDKGDVLGIFAEEILTRGNQPIPVQLNPSPTATKPAYQGNPVTVQDDGTIILPLLPPLNVKDKTLTETRDLIIRMITKDPNTPGSLDLVKPDAVRVLVDLIQPRQYQVLIVREDTQPLPLSAGAGIFGGNKKGAGFTVRLDAYKNDLLHALNATGGPPGLDAKNEVVIRRGQYDPADPTKGYVRIPLRARADEPITFTEQDIILKEGDTVYIEARDTEVYYTAGVMGAAQVPLPRDYDLRVIEAISQVRGSLINGSFQNNAFVANAVNVGIGNPNPSLVTIVRHLPNDQQIRIRVSLNEAFRDTRENILIQPGDIIVLQERPGEALARYLTQTFKLTTTIDVVRSPSFNSIGVSSNP
jgi:protein involved in polysaccharide export with SLBB domain